MANPIKETPVLYGEDAKKFVSENTNINKVSDEVREEISEGYEALKNIAKFNI